MGDGKLNIMKVLCKKVGPFPIKPGNGLGPAIHALVSALTGLGLRGVVENIVTTLEDSINALFLSCTNSKLSTHVRLGRSIIRESSHGDENSNKQILRADWSYIGTQNRVQAFEYTFDSSPKAYQNLPPTQANLTPIGASRIPRTTADQHQEYMVASIGETHVW